MKNKLFLLIVSLLIAVPSKADMDIRQMPPEAQKLWGSVAVTSLKYQGFNDDDLNLDVYERSTDDHHPSVHSVELQELFGILHQETKNVFEYVFSIVNQEGDELGEKARAEIKEYTKYSLEQIEDIPHLVQMWKLVNSVNPLSQFKPRIVAIISTIHSIVGATDQGVDPGQGVEPLYSSQQLAEYLTYLCYEMESVVTDFEKKDLIEARNMALLLFINLN